MTSGIKGGNIILSAGDRRIKQHIIHIRTVVRKINLTEKEKKEVCRCNKCSEVFEQSQIKRVHKEHLGQTIPDTICPHCGSTNWGRINPIVDEEFNTYKSRKFYNKDKRYKNNMKHYNINNFINDDEE